jgi:predicted methyltransferase
LDSTQYVVPTTASEPIRTAIAAPDRSDADRRLDAGRKPAELLAFFGVAPGKKIGELFAAGGYTTELMARALGDTGVIYAQNTKELMDKFLRKPWQDRAAKSVMKRVIGVERPMDDPFPPEAKNLDLVIIVLDYHDTVNMQGVDRSKMSKAVFDVLKTGGIYAIVDHSAQPGSGTRDAATLHRIDETLVRQEIGAAGFKFFGASDVLRNPDDKRDWSCHPKIAAERRGTSDRFVLRFMKP